MRITGRAWKAAAKKWRARVLELEQNLDTSEWWIAAARDRQTKRVAGLHETVLRQDEQLRNMERERYEAEDRARAAERKAKRLQRGW